MGKKNQLSAVQKQSILLLHEEGYQQKSIATRVGVSASTVCRVIHSENPFQVGERTGRPRVTSRHVDSKLKRLVESNPTITSAKAKHEVPELAVVSARTIRRILTSRLDLPSRKVSKNHLCPKTAVKKRIEFCKKYQSWTKERWPEVLFSDASTFKQFTNTNRFVR